MRVHDCFSKLLGSHMAALRRHGMRAVAVMASLHAISPGASAATASADCASKHSLSGYDIVLLAGQSNMTGTGLGYVAAIDGVTHPRIDQMDASTRAIVTASNPLLHPVPSPSIYIGLGMSFANAYLQTLPAQRKVLLVPSARNATGFANNDWNPGTPLFEGAVARMNEAVALAPGNCVAALLWHQGESDALSGVTQAQYAGYLDRFITTLRQRVIGAAQAPFVAGHLVPEWLADATPGKLAVTAALAATPQRVELTAVAGSEGLTSNTTQATTDAIHFDAASQRVLGQRYFAALSSALANTRGGAGSRVIVRGRATLVGGVGAVVALRHNGLLVGTQTVNNTAADQDYVFNTLTPAAAADRIDVVFTNDAVVASEDRNLFVASVKVDGVDLPLTQGTLDLGDGPAAFDGLDLVAPTVYGGWIPWSSALRLRVPGSLTNPSTTVTTLRAQASLVAGVGADLSLLINGTAYGTLQVNASAAQDFSFPNTPVLKTGDKVELVFSNDAVAAGQDRNAFVVSITQPGVTLKPSDSGALIDKGVGAAAFDGLDTVSANIYGGWLPWNGAMRFIVGGAPVTSGTVVVNALATLAGGVGAQMELFINGVNVGTKSVNATTVLSYNFTTPVLNPGDRIDVAFTNNGAVGTEDRNLIVRSVEARGVTMLPGDAGVSYDIGSGAQAFDGLNTVAGNAYGGWMPWDGAMRFVAR